MASAFLLWAAAPPIGAWWVAWVALVPVATVALREEDTRTGRLAVPLTYALYLELLLVPALPFGIARDQWGEPPLPIMVGDSPVLVVALVVIPLAGLLLYLLRFPQPFPRVGALGAILVPAVSWTALDLLRTKGDPGGLFGPLFLSQAGGGGGDLATLAGPWLVTFALVTVNYALAAAVVHRREGIVAAAAAVSTVAVALLAARLVAADPGEHRLAVGVVQAGYDTAEFDRPVVHFLRSATRDLERASLDLAADLAPLTREAAARGADVVVWPEATVWVDPAENTRVREELAALAHETGAAIVAPYFLRAESAGAAVVVRPNGSLTDPQRKERAMWFLGERRVGGDGSGTAVVAGARLATLLGVDTQDPSVARDRAADDATLLAASTHDWRQLVPYHRAAARLAARSLGVPLARSDWRFGSAVYDAGGGELASAGDDKRRALLVAEVPVGEATTLYSRIGDVVGWACAVGSALALGAGAVLRRRASAG